MTMQWDRPAWEVAEWDSPEGRERWSHLSDADKNRVIGTQLFHYTAYEDTQQGVSGYHWTLKDGEGKTISGTQVFSHENVAWGVACPLFVEDWNAAHRVIALFYHRSVSLPFWASIQRQVSEQGEQPEEGALIPWPDAFYFLTPDIVCYAALVAQESSWRR